MKAPQAHLAIGPVVYARAVEQVLRQHGFQVQSSPGARGFGREPSHLYCLDEPTLRAAGPRWLDELRAKTSTPVLVLVPDEQKTPLRPLAHRVRDLILVEPGTHPERFARRLSGLVEPLARLARFQLSLGSEPRPPPPPAPARAFDLVLLGASTGGVRALATVLAHLQAPCPPVVIVQHFPKGSIDLTRELDRSCSMPVREAAFGSEASPHAVWVAAACERHLELERVGGRLRFRPSDAEPVHHQRPAVDVTFASAAAIGPGRRFIGALLTGMGRDGAEGLLQLRRAGARTIAEAEESAVVFGMPRAAIELGAAQEVLPVGAIGPTIARWLRGK